MNEPRFEVGEVAIIVGDCVPTAVGDEVRIVGPLADYYAYDALTRTSGWFYGYRVMHPGAREPGVVLPWFLRKRRPPGGSRFRIDSDETPNALSKFDPAIWTPSAEVVL